LVKISSRRSHNPSLDRSRRDTPIAWRAAECHASRDNRPRSIKEDHRQVTQPASLRRDQSMADAFQVSLDTRGRGLYNRFWKASERDENYHDPVGVEHPLGRNGVGRTAGIRAERTCQRGNPCAHDHRLAAIPLRSEHGSHRLDVLRERPGPITSIAWHGPRRATRARKKRPQPFGSGCRSRSDQDGTRRPGHDCEESSKHFGNGCYWRPSTCGSQRRQGRQATMPAGLDRSQEPDYRHAGLRPQ
jgi:hypothetical protein